MLPNRPLPNPNVGRFAPAGHCIHRLRDAVFHTFGGVTSPEERTGEAEAAKRQPPGARLHKLEQQERSPSARPLVEHSSDDGVKAASFVVELYLGNEREVNRTRVLDVASGDEEVWPSWSPKRLLAFFRSRKELSLLGTEDPESETRPEPLEEHLAGERFALALKDVFDDARPAPVAEAEPPARLLDWMKEPAPPVISSAKMQLIADGSSDTTMRLDHDQAFHVHLEVKLGEGCHTNEALELEWIVMVKSMDMHARFEVAKTRIKFKDGTQQQTLKLDLPGSALPFGHYRPYALMVLRDRHKNHNAAFHMVDGGFLAVN